jgi:prevent-host-death family protein
MDGMASERTMGAAQFKEKCLQVLDELPSEGVVITKRGKPVARLVPFESSGGNLIGVLKGKIRVLGDIEGTGIEWQANGRSRRSSR